jgi:hypothetical protein
MACPATREAVLERGECPLCDYGPEAHRSERPVPPDTSGTPGRYRDDSFRDARDEGRRNATGDEIPPGPRSEEL